METAVEVWKDIPNYKGLYQVSNLGRVKSLKRFRKGNPTLTPVKERILKSALTNCGYVRFRLCKNNIFSNLSIHRLVAISFLKNPKKKPQVNHINGIKTDNRVENLEWCTAKENSKHAFKTGLKSGVKGSLNVNAIINEDDVSKIRKIGKSKTQEEIGNIFGINRRTVGKIIRKITWRHVS